MHGRFSNGLKMKDEWKAYLSEIVKDKMDLMKCLFKVPQTGTVSLDHFHMELMSSPYHTVSPQYST